MGIAEHLLSAGWLRLVIILLLFVVVLLLLVVLLVIIVVLLVVFVLVIIIVVLVLLLVRTHDLDAHALELAVVRLVREAKVHRLGDADALLRPSMTTVSDYASGALAVDRDLQFRPAWNVCLG